MRPWFGLAVIALSLVSMVGCGSEISTAPASGVVLYNGQPLREANVVFAPEQGGPTSVALTGPDGKFTLSMNSGRGALIGKHGVAIQASERYRIDGKPMTDADRQASQTESEVKSPFRVRSKIPETYGNPESSGLSAEVESGGENNFKFELSGKS